MFRRNNRNETKKIFDRNETSETKQKKLGPKRNKRNETKKKFDRNETRETKQKKKFDRNETTETKQKKILTETKQPKRNKKIWNFSIFPKQRFRSPKPLFRPSLQQIASVFFSSLGRVTKNNYNS